MKLQQFPIDTADWNPKHSIHAQHNPWKNKIIQEELNLRRAYKAWNYLSMFRASCDKKMWCVWFLGFWINSLGVWRKMSHFISSARQEISLSPKQLLNGKVIPTETPLPASFGSVGHLLKCRYPGPIKELIHQWKNPSDHFFLPNIEKKSIHSEGQLKTKFLRILKVKNPLSELCQAMLHFLILLQE